MQAAVDLKHILVNKPTHMTLAVKSVFIYQFNLDNTRILPGFSR